MTFAQLEGSTGHSSHVDRLRTGLDALGVALSASQRTDLARFLDLLVRWNSAFNLTAIRAVADMVPAHLLDSLAVCPLVDRHASRTVLDVGSGAGFPGIPLAIARPDLTVTTVDAVAKKISFQQQVKGELALANLFPIASRVEALTLTETPSLVISRAYASLADMLESIAGCVSAATTVIAMKGVVPHDELARLPAGWIASDVVPLDVPFLGAQRCAIVLRRLDAAGGIDR